VAEPIRLQRRLTGAATAGEKLPPARITLSDDTTISTEQPDAARILSAALKCEVRLEKIERKLPEAAASNNETSEGVLARYGRLGALAQAGLIALTVG
jgi:hypothetical protein